MRTKLAWLLLLPLGLALGCNGDDDDGPDTDPPAGDDDDDVPPGDDDDDALDQARVRVLNLSDSLGLADVFVERIDSADDALDLDERAANEVVQFDDLAVEETSPYLAVAAGTREIELYADGVDTPALELQADLAADMDHTVVVYGDLPDLDSLVIEDDTSAVPADAVAIEVMNLNEDGTEMTVFDATPEPAPVVQLAQIPPEGAVVEGGTSLRLEIHAEVTTLGIDLDGDSATDFEFALPLDLELGELFYLALRDDGAGGLEAILISPDGDTQELEEPVPGPLSEVRIANISPDLAFADVLLEEVPLDGGGDLPLIDRAVEDVLTFDSMGVAEASAFADVTAGMRDLEIYADGAVTPLVDVEIEALAGEEHTVFTFGEGLALDVVALVDDDEAIAAGDVALQITNLALDTGEVDLLDLSDIGAPVILADDLALEATLRTDVDAGVSLLGIDVDDDLVADFTFAVLPPLAADSHVHVVIGNDTLSGSPFLFLVFEDGGSALLAPLPPVGP